MDLMASIQPTMQKTFMLENRLKSAVKHSIEKFVSLYIVNLSTILCPKLYTDAAMEFSHINRTK